jgi:hypothetical protein
LQAQRPQAACVGIVPVHETETWALADGDALRQAFGVTYTDRDMKLPSPHELERLDDPKLELRAIHLRVRGRRRRVATLPLTGIAQSIRMDCLRRLEAFRVFETELRTGLRQLGLLAPG